MKKPRRSADGRVARERKLGALGEDVDGAGFAGSCLLVDKDCLGEIKLARDGLLLVLSELGFCWGGGKDHGERVPLVPFRGEDVEGDKVDVVCHFLNTRVM